MTHDRPAPLTCPAPPSRAALLDEVQRLRAELDALRAARTDPEPPPPVESRARWDEGRLYVGGELRGYVANYGTAWLACLNVAVYLPDERTARAVLLALAGEDPSSPIGLSIREPVDWQAIGEAWDALGPYIGPMLCDLSEGIRQPQLVGAEEARTWARSDAARRCMDLRVDDGADGRPL